MNRKKATQVFIVFALTLILFSFFITPVSARSRTDPENTYSVRVETNPLMKDGAHADRIHIPYGETCTLTMDTGVDDFVFWNLYGDYEIVAGDYQEKSFTIRPLSDLVAVATYTEAMPHTVVEDSDNPLCVQTGQEDNPALVIGCILLIVWGAIAIKGLNIAFRDDDDEWGR